MAGIGRLAPLVSVRVHLALFTGGAVGVGGGLLGLGGAEFRLPLLVAAFRYDLPQAIAINVVVTLVTVVAGAAARLAVPGASLAALEPMAPMAASVAAGSVVGAFAGSTWVGRVSVRALQRAVRFLLVSIGALLVIEGLWSWPDSATATGGPGQVALGVIAGLAIGVVASLLGVAGGELIIPTLVYGFGAEIHVAGTLSLLISVPTLLVSLWRQRAALAGPGGLWPVVLPMWIGSVAGAAIGGALTRTFPADWLKLILGAVLIGSALHVFGIHSVSRWRKLAMTLSARNLLKGRVVGVMRGATTAHVKIDIGGGTIITASITNEAVDDLAVAAGGG